MGGQFILGSADGAQCKVPFFQQSIVSVTNQMQIETFEIKGMGWLSLGRDWLA